MRKVALLLLLMLPAGELLAAKIRIVVETPGGVHQRVYLARPSKLGADRPIVFLMHGEGRNAAELRNRWYGLAVEHDFLLVVPEFNERDFPGVQGYEFGNVYGPKGGARDPSRWAFSAIEPLFDELRQRYGMTAATYGLFGEAAGAGFVHRFVYHVPDARVTRAVAANAGWYTMPEFGTPFPYGLRDSTLGPKKFRLALQRPLIILLSEGATATEGDDFRQTPEAMAQGASRFARGRAFFEAGQAAAARLGLALGWQTDTVSGSGLDDEKLLEVAIPYLLEGGVGLDALGRRAAPPARAFAARPSSPP